MCNLIWIKRRISNALSEVGSVSEMRIDWKSLQPVFLENSADVQIICKTSRINYGNEADTPWMTKFYVNVSNNLKLQLNTPPPFPEQPMGIGHHMCRGVGNGMWILPMVGWGICIRSVKSFWQNTNVVSLNLVVRVNI